MSQRNHAALSGDFSAVTLAAETDEVLICLLAISYPTLAAPIRISSDMTEVYGYDDESGAPIYCTRHRGDAPNPVLTGGMGCFISSSRVG